MFTVMLRHQKQKVQIQRLLKVRSIGDHDTNNVICVMQRWMLDFWGDTCYLYFLSCPWLF